MMRYKGLVQREMEKAMMTLNSVITGMDNKNISEQDAYNKLKYVLDRFNFINEKINLEPDQNT